MNMYWCCVRDSDSGCFVVAETRGKAKALYAQYDGMENFIEYRAQTMRRDIDASIKPGVYDENTPELALAGVKYIEDEED